MPLDNKISNIIGTKLPQWVLNQLETRSNKNTQDSRDNDNILYLANKSAWVRLVSSVNINDYRDLTYFKNIVGANIESTKLFGADIINPTSLAKQYVLFGGTSKYLNNNSYGLRSGLDYDGSYGMLGKGEVQQFGYKPMPGITNVTIETQGRLGSVRGAIINFKCWDKNQLDIIDALYFKLGFTMFLEWGHTFYYPSPQNTYHRDPDKIISTELYSIDPFEEGLNKEDIQIRIAKNSRETEGNYDAMLGICTNFNFTYTQDGGYDCTLRLMGLGVLGDSIKINNSGTLPNLLEEEIKQLNSTLIEIAKANNQANGTSPGVNQNQDTIVSIFRYLNKIIFNKDRDPDNAEKFRIVANAGILGSQYEKNNNTPNSAYDFIYNDSKYTGLTLYLQKFGLRIPEDNTENFITDITLDPIELSKAINSYYIAYFDSKRRPKGPILTFEELFFSLDSNSFLSGQNSYKSYPIPYIGKNGKYYFIQIEITLPGGDEHTYLSEINNAFPIAFTDDIEKGRIFINKKRSDLIKDTLSDIKFGTFETTTFNEVKIDIVENTTQQRNFSLLNTKALDTVPLNIGDLGTVTNSTIQGKENFVLSLQSTFNIQGTKKEKKLGISSQDIVSTDTFALGSINIKITDTSLIKSITPKSQDIVFSEYFNPTDVTTENTNTEQDQKKEQEAISTQIKQALNYQSTLEIMLRTIQLHALNKAINKTGKPDLEIGRTTYVLNIWDSRDKIGDKTFLTQIFSTGIFSKFIEKLVFNPIKCDDYTQDKTITPETRFQTYSYYGFATSLLGNKEGICSLEPVNFEELLKAYVVPYQINQEIIKGTSTNHPVYIPLGLILMILNHACTIYDSKESGNFQTPLVYIDFNPELNFCLTNTKQLSTDPWTCLIPFEGSFEDYKQLFDKDILTSGSRAIDHTSGSTEIVPLFNPDTQDYLSKTLPKLKFDEYTNSENQKESGNIYRGKVMNILLNIDYLVQLAQQYSYKDGTNSVYLKTFIEQMLSDINKSLGNFNAFRLSYNDSANTFQIIDDQFVPSLSSEEQVTPKSNRTELPLSGKFSIAKSLEIKSEVSSRLSNMLAISANSNSANKATLSTNGDSFGFINTAYTDRYIVNRGEISGSIEERRNNDSLKISAAQFNSTISDFYSKINPSQTNVAHATNYYIEKMTVIKNDEYATRAASMIPVSVNFTTDGISGLGMGQAFTVSDQLLPYTYTTRKIPGAPQDHINNVGFVMVGLTHTIENNQWNTAVRANMIYLKDKTEFSGSVIKTNFATGVFGVNTFNEVGQYDSILSTRDFSNYPIVDSSYSNIKFGKGNLGSPGNDRINPNLLNDINKAAADSGVVVTITTAVSGHNTFTSTGNPSRHSYGNAVDIAIIDGVAVSKKQDVVAKVDKFVSKLMLQGYSRDVETGKQKSVLTYKFRNHDNHIHISNIG